jgi:hypothetical protein
MKTLDQIGQEQGTDRSSHGWHDYLCTYDEIFSPLRDKPITIMEMGTMGLAGIRMWSEYFTNPKTVIVGIDIQDYGGKRPDDGRVILKLGSQTDGAFLDTLAPSYDVIIDDAGHFAGAQIESFRLLWTRVNPGGCYVIEDLHTAWSPQHCNHALTIIQFIEQIIEEMQDHAGPEGRAKPDPADKWYAIDQIILRKGLAILRKRT